MPNEAPLMQELLLSVIVVTWNVRQIVGRCLEAILASETDAPFEIILIDNASSDGTADFVAEHFPSVRLVRNAEGRGFAGGNNQAFALARGQYCLLVNPDAFPTSKETFRALVRFLEAYPDYAGCGCKLIFPDGRHQIGDAGYRPTIAHVAFYALGITQVIVGVKGCFISGVQSRRAAVLDVDWICGACFLIRTSVIGAAGGMNPDYFIYGNDLEWGCRIRDHGMRLAYLPGESVIHLQGWTENRADRRRVSTRWLDGLAKAYSSQSGGRHWRTFKILLALGFGLRALAYQCLALLRGSSDLRNKACAMQIFAFYAAKMSQSRLVT